MGTRSSLISVSDVRSALWVSLLAAPLWLGCGGVGGEDYLGEALLVETGVVKGVQSGAFPGARIGLFWSPTGSVEIDDGTLIEHSGSTAEIAGAGSFELRVFNPPPAGAFHPSSPDVALGVLRAYVDTNGDGVFTPGAIPSEQIGGDEELVLIYTRAAVDAALSPTGQTLQQGFEWTTLPLPCASVRFGEPSNTPSPFDLIGLTCTSDAQCGAGGKCVPEAGEAFLNGADYRQFCVLDPDALPIQCGRLPYKAGYSEECSKQTWENANGNVIDGESEHSHTGTIYLQKCASDAECPVDTCHECDMGDCALYTPSTRVACSAFDRPCDVALGSPCGQATDCGPDGTCVHQMGQHLFPGGMCAVSPKLNCQLSNAVGFSPTLVLPTDDSQTDPDCLEALDAQKSDDQFDFTPVWHQLENGRMWMQRCSSSAECRQAEGYTCDLDRGVCLPMPELTVYMDDCFRPTPLCR